MMEGKIVKILGERSGVSTGGNKPWVKLEVLLQLSNSDFLVVTGWGDKATALKSAKVGQDIDIEFTVKSREYKDKWYTECNITKLILEE